MSIYKHRQPPRAQAQAQAHLHDPRRRLDRPPTSRPSAPSSLSFSSSAAVFSRANVRLAELHGNALEERVRLATAVGEGNLKDGLELGKGVEKISGGGGATVNLRVDDATSTGGQLEGGLGATTNPRSEVGSPYHVPRLSRPEPGDGHQSKRRRESPSPSQVPKRCGSESSLSSLTSMSESEGEEPERKRTRVWYGDGDVVRCGRWREVEEEKRRVRGLGGGGEEGGEEDEDEGGDENDEGEDEDEYEYEGEDEHDEDDAGRVEEDEEDDEEGVEVDVEDDDEYEEESASEDDDEDSDYGGRSKHLRVPSPKGEYRMPMSMRLQQRRVSELEAETSNTKSELNDEQEEGLRNQGMSQGRGDSKQTKTLSAKSDTPTRSTATKIPPKPTPPSVPRSTPTSTRLQERQLKERAESEARRATTAVFHATPKRRVHWELGARARSPERSPLSMRLQARMLKEREVRDRERVDRGGGVQGLGKRSALSWSVPETVDGGGLTTEDATATVDEESPRTPDSRPPVGFEKARNVDNDQAPPEEDAGASGTESEPGAVSLAWLSGCRNKHMAKVVLRSILSCDGRAQEQTKDSADAGVMSVVTGRRRCEPLPTASIEPSGEPQGLDALAGLASGRVEGSGKEEKNAGAQSDEVSPSEDHLDDSPSHKRRSSARLANINSERNHQAASPNVSAARTRPVSIPKTKKKTPAGKKAKAKAPIDQDESDASEGPKTVVVQELEEVRRAKLAYPPTGKGKTVKRTVDYNSKKPVDWETSLAKQVALRMEEMKQPSPVQASASLSFDAKGRTIYGAE